MKPKEKNVKKNDKGEYLFWAYTYRNVHTGLYYVGATVNPSNRKSLWKNLKYKYAGDKVYKARQQYHDWENDWEYTAFEYTAPCYDSMISEMEFTEAYLISYYDSYHNGYNTKPSGSGRGSRSRILVKKDDGSTLIFNSNEDASYGMRMSPGNIYHYAYVDPTHTRRNTIFLPIDDEKTMSALPPTFLTDNNITLPS